MRLDILISSMAISLVVLVLLGRKWQMPMRTVVPGALAIGVLAWAATRGLSAVLDDPGIVFLGLTELSFALLFALLGIMLRFYRDPARIPVETERVILSPADGEVVYVKVIEGPSSLVSIKHGRRIPLNEIMTTDLLSNPTYLVGIGMNMLDVHVNRSPVSGKIILQKHVPGRFLSLRRPESVLTNERVTTVIENGEFRTAVIQIASRLVRRIISYHREGDDLPIGERIGSIRFGSQVDLVIPQLTGLQLEVSPGDRVKAGISVLARYGTIQSNGDGN